MIPIPENHLESQKIKLFLAAVFLCIYPLNIFSQEAKKQIVRVEKMEYLYNPNVSESANNFALNYDYRVILATDSVVEKKMKQSILLALDNRWNTTSLNAKWDFNQINASGKFPKFKTKLKKGIPGSWHLFFQVTDNGQFPITDKTGNLFESQSLESMDYTPYYMQIKVLLLDGSNESVVFSNDLNVEMHRSTVPEGQLLLRKIPALTDSFLQAFDDAVQKLFLPSSQNDIKLHISAVSPACLYVETDEKIRNAQKLSFNIKEDSIVELPALQQSWVIQKIKTQKTGRVNNFGNNLFNSSLTLLTGLNTDKIRSKRYLATLGFKDLNEKSNYSCKIAFIEETREETERETEINSDGSKTRSRTENGVVQKKRYADPKQNAFVMQEKDTIGTFKVRLGNRAKSKGHFSRCWDGKNETSIRPMPEFWNNTAIAQNISSEPFFIEGKLFNQSFVIENSKAGNQIDLEIDSQEIATIKMSNNLPVEGLLYKNTIDNKTLRILMMLSTLTLGYPQQYN
ncbi:hypothetical protein D3C84_126700 [compost metagenome]